MNGLNLEQYLTDGVKSLIGQAARATLTNPKESIFLAKYSLIMKKAEKKRKTAEQNGEHIPPFLIASITSSCNLHCAGCYSRASHACSDAAPVGQLTAGEWNRIFTEAVQLGIGFILLAGGEPLLRRDVLTVAAEHPEIIFPVFTNGTMLDDEYCELLDNHRNIVPVVSVEGHRSTTDLRRGDGVFDAVSAAMEKMKARHVTFGASVTQTMSNMEEITGTAFLDQLRGAGASVVFYVEFVPVASGTENLAPDDKARATMRARLDEIRAEYPDILFISFPGDEKSSGGCLAAGRGFFHINSHGGAEPCPFSPYSDINVKNASLREALKSPLFNALRDGSLLLDEHNGGCVLYERRELVEKLVKQSCCDSKK